MSVRVAAYEASARVVPGRWWIAGYAAYQRRVRGRGAGLARVVHVQRHCYRLEFADGFSIHMVAPGRASRYLGRSSPATIVAEMAVKYLPADWHPTDPVRVIDVGANVGEFALAVLGRVPTAEVVCVEPDPVVQPALRANLARYPNATVVPVALGEAPGTATLWSAWRDADSSLIRPPGRSTPVTVPVTTLDDLVAGLGWDRVSLVKMDAEGAEPEVLRGGGRALTRTEWISVEAGAERHGQTTATEVRAQLGAAGFTLRSDPVGWMVRADRAIGSSAA